MIASVPRIRARGPRVHAGGVLDLWVVTLLVGGAAYIGEEIK